MVVKLTPAELAGTVTPPPSKSQAHRALIAAYLANSVEQLDHLADSQDIQATRRCMEALLAPGEGIPRLDCGESGSTLRFLIPLALALGGGGAFTGRGRLMERPQGPYFTLFDQKGIAYEQKDGVLTVRGRLTPGTYALPGDVSSQFVTGLLYALPLLAGDSEIVLTSPLESRGYVDMTVDVLRRFGVEVGERGSGFAVPGGQRFRSCPMTIEADWSQAAFWFAAMSLGHLVDVAGLDDRSVQGDRVIGDLFVRLQWREDMNLDVSGCPDLAPPLAAMAALRAGRTTRLVNAARLRIKESDRLASVTQVLNALGADVTEGPDSLEIQGKETLSGGVTVDSFNDHRIAMMAAIAATRCGKPVTVLGAECVAKSYPNFWDDYEALGGKIQKTNGVTPNGNDKIDPSL